MLKNECENSEDAHEAPKGVTGKVVVSRMNSSELANAAQAEDEGISYERLGVDIPLDDVGDELYLNAGRIRSIENMTLVPQLKVLCLSAHLIEKVEGLDSLSQLRHLELYQNNIRCIENLSLLTQLEILDLSFNAIRVIEGLSTLKRLEKLMLSSNKITEMQGLETLGNLKVLELGGNRIRKIQNIENMEQLEQLWLGKNKIECMALSNPLLKLKQISLQSNRLIAWDESLIQNAPNLEELYISHNRLTYIPESIAKLKSLRVLDIAGNKISDLSALRANKALEELWVNDNEVESLDAVQVLRDLPNLKTVYLERNPIQDKLGPGYRTALMQLAPNLEQLDAVLLQQTFTVCTSKSSK